VINPLVDLVNKVRSRFSASGNVAPAKERSEVVPAGKPAGERLSKTVMPNVTRTIAPQDPLNAAAENTTAPSAATTAKTGPRMISLGATQPSRQSKDLPPAIALALEPKVERAISLQLSDIIKQIPVGYIKSEESFDPTRRVLLKAVEIEKGMAARNPSVALASVYEQIPEIFLRSVEITDQKHIALPFEKVLEQFNRVQVRRDQLRDNVVPQVDTPFLVVALEESEKFGTTIEPLQSSALPSVKVEAASAESFAAAEPEAAKSETAAAPSPPRSGISRLESDMSEELPHHLAPAPARIPFHLPPKGTGAPASERVPASSGPPVLPSVPPSPRKRTLRNPYETVPFDQVQFSDLEKRSTSDRPAELERPRRRKPTESDNLDQITAPVPNTPPVADTAPVPHTAPVPATPQRVEEKIELSLRTLLQNLPAFQRKGDPSLAPEDAKVSLPFSLIADQLATGRISVAPKTFHEAIPTDYRDLFQLDEAETPVMLPLQEVLKNVPAAALRMRTDQEALVENETIETPFSIQAEEDARRFRGEEPPALDLISDSQATIDQKPAEEVEKVDAKEVVARATKLPGVNGCAITFADGLSLAGNLPPAISADGLCAVAPTLLQRIERHMFDTKLGPLKSMTLHGATSAVTFFMKGNICLSALHTTEELAAETRRQLAKIVDELSRTYSQPEISHVDH
jgi:predicted regulator of Ras-like GTPase activity (Roadblock/LC7/MglB family)